MTQVTVSSKGWIVIPADLRRKYDLNPGDQVQVVDFDGVLGIVPALSDPVVESAGMLAGESSLSDALRAERAQELARGR
jgi:AbrB family looped-hinge helix DNA binding protein